MGSAFIQSDDSLPAADEILWAISRFCYQSPHPKGERGSEILVAAAGLNKTPTMERQGHDYYLGTGEWDRPEACRNERKCELVDLRTLACWRSRTVYENDPDSGNIMGHFGSTSVYMVLVSLCFKKYRYLAVLVEGELYTVGCD